MIVVPSNVSPAPTITGLVLRDGLSGVSLKSPVRIEGKTFISNNDQLDFKIGGGGITRGNIMRAALDDGIDINHPVADLSVIDNTIVDSGGDGVEMRLNDDSFTPTADILFRGNDISGSRSDGIQIIDYFTDTNRVIAIERNVIHDNGRAGVGSALLDGGTTVEDFRAASIRERITVINNTLVRNDHGISGGDNLFANSNIFVGHVLALKNVDAGSVASHNLFWQNATNQTGSNVEASLLADPLLDASYRLAAGSPAIDEGVAHFERSGEVIWDEPTANYVGSAPDLGWRERGASGGSGWVPTITSVAIAPTNPRTNTLLTANATATDPEGNAISFAYQWKRNGSNVAGATARTLDLSVAGNGDKGDSISVAVIASDGSSESTPVSSSPVTVLNSEPTFRADLGNLSNVEGDSVKPPRERPTPMAMPSPTRRRASHLACRSTPRQARSPAPSTPVPLRAAHTPLASPSATRQPPTPRTRSAGRSPPGQHPRSSSTGRRASRTPRGRGCRSRGRPASSPGTSSPRRSSSSARRP